MGTTRVTQFVEAPRRAVYRALLDAEALEYWRVPDNMRAEVHELEPREGGRIRVSLTYRGKGAGKTSARTDTYHGHFERLVPDEQVVEVIEFETEDPALRGQMRITITLVDAPGGTEVIGVHEGVPDVVPPADNEVGWQMSLRKLAKLCEG
jgi:uncharacterized protein YndB with AHSA1/START domain